MKRFVEILALSIIIANIGCIGQNVNMNLPLYANVPSVEEIRTNIEQLENERISSPVPYGIDAQLALYYTLLARMDLSLSFEERQDLYNRGLTIVEKLIIHNQEARGDETDSKLFLYSWLAQIHATIGNIRLAYTTLDKLESQYVENQEIVLRIREIRSRLERAISDGYPYGGEPLQSIEFSPKD